ncbi:MAG: hypothetical protein C0592_08345 [Marinilabiliales bacterium]|nr:MAG: hypothetical protein C0592_08345 [Marinilabiliales bacterium]
MLMKKSTRFEDKLKVYASLAMGVAGIGVASGQVVYHDENPDVTITTAGDSISIDMDGDMTMDFSIKRQDWSAGGTTTVLRPVIGNGAMGTYTGIVPYLSALALNAPINSSGNWVVNDGTSAQYHKMCLASSYSGAYYGNFGDQNDHYIGVTFITGGNYHYGWIRVADLPLNGSVVTVKDWAYDATPDTQILAGATVTNIEQGVINDANIFAYDKQVTIKLSEQVEGTVRIYNALGQEVYSDVISDVNMVIDMPTAQAGIYTVVVESNNYVTQKKVSL